MKIWIPISSVIVLFWVAFRWYGARISRYARLSEDAVTPAHSKADGFDFVPTSKSILLAQHFASIAAAGPIVGPIAAAIAFGWLPTLLWITLGCIAIGSVHDFSSLIASVRSGACSIPEIAKARLGLSGYRGILAFIWLCLVYVILAFTDVTAQQFVAIENWGGEEHSIGAGVATSSILYLFLSMLLGVITQRGWLSTRWATLFFFPALLFIIFIGQLIPMELSVTNPIMVWSVLILIYCAMASLLPMWLLLQPRGYLGGFFLYTILALGSLGLLFGSFDVQYPTFKGFTSAQGLPLFPFLFITVACGACSGFHGLVCSGTTSKQLSKEPHAQLVGYGGMLLEGIVAIIALATVMILPAQDALLTKSPSEVYATGIARFAHTLFGLDLSWGLTFGMLAFATFVYDTLDVATRLGRYLVQELFGWDGWRGRAAATAITLALPTVYALGAPTPAHGTPPLWTTIWPLFGSSNQLLAALTLMLMGLWFSSKAAIPVWLSIPAALMWVTSVSALTLQLTAAIRSLTSGFGVIPLLNAVLCTALLFVAVSFTLSFFRTRRALAETEALAMREQVND